MSASAEPIPGTRVLTDEEQAEMEELVLAMSVPLDEVKAGIAILALMDLLAMTVAACEQTAKRDLLLQALLPRIGPLLAHRISTYRKHPRPGVKTV